MPANKNAMTRYAIIDSILSNHNRACSVQDITDLLNYKLEEAGYDAVSKRCVEKDLNYLEFESPFDVELEVFHVDAADRNGRPYRKRCVRYADRSFSIFKSRLSEEEKRSLSMAVETIGAFDGLENFEWLADLQKEFTAGEQTPVIQMSKNLLSCSSLIASLYSAIKNQRVLRLSYHTHTNPSIRQTEISPQLLKEYNCRWFLIASACDTGKILTFPLENIDGFDEIHTYKYAARQEELTERYEDVIGITVPEEDPLLKILIWVSSKSAPYVSTKPIHPSQTRLSAPSATSLRERYPALEGGEFFRLECKENYELIRELTSFGPELLVLSPAPLRDKIRDRLTSMLTAYASLS